jgi:hypothetical protein
MDTTSQQPKEPYFIGYSCYPIREDSEGDVFRCDEDRAEMWGIYGVLCDQTECHLFDVQFKAQAESIIAMMEYRIVRTLELIKAYANEEKPWVHYTAQGFVNGVLKSSLTD